MSTKISIFYDDKLHIYQEAFDENHVYIELCENAIKTTITLTLTQAIGLAKNLCYADFKKQSEITDEQIERFVRESVKARLGKEDIFAVLGCIVYGSTSDSEEAQIQAGSKHYKGVRDRMKSVIENLESKRTGSKMQFGLEEL